MTYDKLIAGMTPATKVASGTVRKLAAAATYARGTVLARSSGTAGDNKLVILGTAPVTNEVLTPDCVLCDDTDIGAADENAAVYVAGCFNYDALSVKSGYTITQADIDKLRERGIYLGELLD
jgi:hypothetical protein